MNSIPKEKRRPVLLVVVVTVVVLAGLWFGLINLQYQRLTELADSVDAARRKLDTANKALKGAKQLEANLATATEALNGIEESMAAGDKYLWVINKIRQFNLGYRVDIPRFSTIVETDTTLLPKFPYKQVTLAISGTAFFHDLGRFVADFENQFPYARIENLELEPTPVLAGAEKEKLTFSMKIVTLVKPGST